MEEIEKIKQLINENDVISFDIFDTLLLRNVEKPTDIFKIIEGKYSIKDFCTKRIQAEADSRIGQKNYESNLERIYDFLQKYYDLNIDYLKEKELELELEFICQNKFMKKIFDYCVKNNKKIILISDMYLSKKFIKKLLAKCEYTNYDDIFISNEIGESKHVGGLYDFVREKKQLNINKWLHIGDNLHSDVNIPTKKGINSYHYNQVSKIKKRISESPNYKLSIMRGIQNNFIINNEKELGYWECFGIKNASPIYYSFTDWIFNLTKSKENIYFLSRDGYIIKKIYDIFKDVRKSKTKTHYLYTSRLAYQIPYTVFDNKEQFINMITEGNSLFNEIPTINDVFELLNLNKKNYIKTLELFNINDFNIKLKNDVLENMKKFLRYIYSDIELNFKDKLNKVIKYLTQEKVNDCKEIIFVDIGWRGSIQRTINKILKRESFGYYFGTGGNVYKSLKMNSLGYAFDNGSLGNNGNFILDNIMMFEMLFSAPEGTLLSFESTPNGIYPVLEKNNKIEVRISAFQESSIEVIKKYLEYSDYLFNISIDECIIDYKDFINYKKYKDLLEFKDLNNDVGYGTQKKEYVKVYSKDYIIHNYDDFVNDINKSLWKNSYYINDIKSQKELDDFRNIIYNIHSLKKYKKINMETIKKIIKNPNKVKGVLKVKKFYAKEKR